MYGGAAGTDETDAALAAFGLEREGDLAEPEDLDIYPENEAPVCLFMAMGTQWREGMNGRTGLDYAALEAVARITGIELTRDRFDGVRIMESEILNLTSEHHGRQ